MVAELTALLKAFSLKFLFWCSELSYTRPPPVTSKGSTDGKNIELSACHWFRYSFDSVSEVIIYPRSDVFCYFPMNLFQLEMNQERISINFLIIIVFLTTTIFLLLLLLLTLTILIVLLLLIIRTIIIIIIIIKTGICLTKSRINATNQILRAKLSNISTLLVLSFFLNCSWSF